MKYLRLIRFLVVHLFFLISTFFCLHYFGFIERLPSSDYLLQWDANWYNSVRLNGYEFSQDAQSNVGFYPLFPLLWRFLNVSALWMSITNGCIGLLSVFLMSRFFQIKEQYSLLFLSLPSLIFMYVPYAESLFFLGSTLFLIGLKKDKKVWIAFGLFIASLAKATSVFFIPALFFGLLINTTFAQFNFRSFCKNFLFSTFFVLLGVAAVSLIQLHETGRWFVYFDAQAVQWNRAFSIPVFPLTTWDAHRLLFLDVIALFVGILALFIAFQCTYQWFRRKIIHPANFETHYLFSLAFLVLVMCSVLFFSPMEESTDTTSIFGINRYMFVSPFFFVFLQHHLSNTKLNLWQFACFMLLALLTWCLFYEFSEADYYLVFLSLTLYVALGLAMLYNPRLSYFWIPLYGINVILQAWVFNIYISGYWVG